MISFSRKARIQSHDELAEAIEMSSKKLRSEIEKGNDLDSEISVSKVPEHLQFLVSDVYISYTTSLADITQVSPVRGPYCINLDPCRGHNRTIS